MMGEGARTRPEVTENERPSLTTDVVFKTLSNQRRRYVLHYLKQRNTEQPVTVRTLSEQIAAWENRIDRTEVNPKQRKRIYTALHQTHLPKMDQLGIVNYDRNRGTVLLVDSVEQFDIYFDMLNTSEMPWSHVYLGLGSVTTTLAVCIWLSIWPFTLVSGEVYALVLSVSLVAVASFHVYQERSHFLGASGTPPESDIPLSAPSDGTTTDDQE